VIIQPGDERVKQPAALGAGPGRGRLGGGLGQREEQHRL
jgi:hypothetical protein